MLFFIRVLYPGTSGRSFQAHEGWVAQKIRSAATEKGRLVIWTSYHTLIHDHCIIIVRIIAFFAFFCLSHISKIFESFSFWPKAIAAAGYAHSSTHDASTQGGLTHPEKMTRDWTPGQRNNMKGRWNESLDFRGVPCEAWQGSVWIYKRWRRLHIEWLEGKKGSERLHIQEIDLS